MKADFIKQAILNKLGMKSQAICDKAGLPVNAEWATTMFADVMEVKNNGNILIYEIKSCKADFNSDKKYLNYLEHCHLLYFVADKETIEHIESKADPRVGLYVIGKSGHMECKRRAKNTKNKFDSKAIALGILKKSQYRYLKFWREKTLEQ